MSLLSENGAPKTSIEPAAMQKALTIAISDRGDEGAEHRPHAAHDDDDERVADQREVEVEVGGLVRHLQRAAERREEGAEREHRR